jgi:hypothetical protein
MGAVITGLVIGGLACAWHEVLKALATHSGRVNDPATVSESGIPRAA